MLRNVSNLLIKTVFGKKNAGTSITHVKIHHMQIPLQILNNKGMENTSCKTFFFGFFLQILWHEYIIRLKTYWFALFIQ